MWVDEAERPVGFQFCYGRPRAEHALTWNADQGFRHTVVDDGENVGLGYKATPILVPGGTLDVNRLATLVSEAGADVPADITAFVLETLRAHPAYVHRPR